VLHHLTNEQIKFLNRGPTYVTPCQMRLSAPTSDSLEHVLIKQMAPLRRQLATLFSTFRVDLSHRMRFERDIEQSFKQSFSLPIPSNIEQRATYEIQLLRSIQSQLAKEQLILRRTADNKNTYYIGSLQTFNHKTAEFMDKANNYEMMGTIDEINTQEQHLNNRRQLIETALVELHRKKLIQQDHLSKMVTNTRSTVNLPHLYFLPAIHPVSTNQSLLSYPQ
jgi:hypothetical protein